MEVLAGVVSFGVSLLCLQLATPLLPLLVVVHLCMSSLGVSLGV
jgi:hypothetical protein